MFWNLSVISFFLFQSVYVEFLNTGICFSRIGRVYWPFPLPQSIFIGRCAHLIGHIKHEMMHTMGFYHEHSRSDRDDYINIEWDNISDGREDQFETYRYWLIKRCDILFSKIVNSYSRNGRSIIFPTIIDGQLRLEKDMITTRSCTIHPKRFQNNPSEMSRC